MKSQPQIKIFSQEQDPPSWQDQPEDHRSQEDSVKTFLLNLNIFQSSSTKFSRVRAQDRDRVVNRRRRKPF